jgi:hypothetical protein
MDPWTVSVQAITAALAVKGVSPSEKLVEPIEDEFITDRRLEGLGTTVIARELYRYIGSRRSQATINMRLKTLAAKEEDQ